MFSVPQLIKIRNIIVLFIGTIMFFSCKTDINEVYKLVAQDNLPEVVIENAQMWYSDSARLKYYVETPLFEEYKKDGAKYQEYKQGLYAALYGKTGGEVGSIRSEYAIYYEDDKLWELRNKVVAINAEGKKLETELLFWDMEKETIYTDRLARFTAGAQVIIGKDGFESDQQLNNPEFKNVSGQLELEN